MRIKLFYLLSPQSTINNVSGVMINNSDPNSIPQPGLSGLINLIILVVISSCHSHSLICTCRGQNIRENILFSYFVNSHHWLVIIRGHVVSSNLFTECCSQEDSVLKNDNCFRRGLFCAGRQFL